MLICLPLVVIVQNIEGKKKKPSELSCLTLTYSLINYFSQFHHNFTLKFHRKTMIGPLLRVDWLGISVS